MLRLFSRAIALAAILLAVGPLAAGDPIRVLIIDGRNNHDWRSTTPVLEAVLENTGRFAVDVATAPDGQDFAGFRPDIPRYDVVLSNYNGELWPEETRKAFVEHVRSGGGAVIVHAANNAFPEWEEWNEIIGLGGWGGRTEKHGPYVRFREGEVVRDDSPGRGGSHGRQHEYVVVSRAPDHPIVAGLPEKWMHARDELYDRLRGPAKRLEVLATAWSDPETGGSGEHEPILMTIEYGKGRVFHTVLGDNAGSMKGVGFQVTLQRGTEWAATGEVTSPAVSAEELPADRAAHRDPDDIPPAGDGWVAPPRTVPTSIMTAQAPRLPRGVRQASS